MKRMVLSLLSVIVLLPLLTFPVYGAPPTADKNEDTSLMLQNPPAAPTGPQRTDVFDIYGPLSLPDPINWLPFIISAGILILVVALLIWYLKRRWKKPAIAPVLPHITALADLEMAREYLLNNQSFMYAERISEILRSYIEKIFNISSTRQTTTEFLFAVQAGTNSANSTLLSHREQLSKCMQQCDMAKFARKKANIEGMEDMEKSVHQFIDSTKPAEEDN